MNDFLLMNDEELKGCGNPVLCLETAAFSLVSQKSMNHVNEPGGGTKTRDHRGDVVLPMLIHIIKSSWLVSSSDQETMTKCIQSAQSVSCRHFKLCRQLFRKTTSELLHCFPDWTSCLSVIYDKTKLFQLIFLFFFIFRRQKLLKPPGCLNSIQRSYWFTFHRALVCLLGHARFKLHV